MTDRARPPMPQVQAMRLLANAKSAVEYNAALDLIKLGYDGQFPPWYAPAVVLSGLEKAKLEQFAAGRTDG